MRITDADLDRTVTLGEIINECDKAADKYERQLQMALSSDRVDAGIMDVIAYFERKMDLYRDEIPDAIYSMIFADKARGNAPERDVRHDGRKRTVAIGRGGPEKYGIDTSDGCSVYIDADDGKAKGASLAQIMRVAFRMRPDRLVIEDVQEFG